MKRVLLFGVLLLVLGVVGYLGSRTISQANTNKERKIQLQALPDLTKLLTKIPSDQLPAMLEGHTNVIILFDPDCEHCQYEAEAIHQRAAKFKAAKVWFLSKAEPTKVNGFARNYGLDSLPQVHVSSVTANDLYNAFGPTSVPHIFIYGSDGRLRKEFRGETKIEAILKYI